MVKDNRAVSRRKVLAVGGGTFTVGVAGCSDTEEEFTPVDDSQSESDTTDDDSGSDLDLTSYQSGTIENSRHEMDWIESESSVNHKVLRHQTLAALTGYRPEILDAITTETDAPERYIEDVPHVHRGFDIEFRVVETIEGMIINKRHLRVDFDRERIWRQTVRRGNAPLGSIPSDAGYNDGFKRENFLNTEGDWSQRRFLRGAFDHDYNYFPSGYPGRLSYYFNNIADLMNGLFSIKSDFELTEPDALDNGPPFFYQLPDDVSLSVDWQGDDVADRRMWNELFEEGLGRIGSTTTPFDISSFKASLGGWIPVQEILIQGSNQHNKPVTVAIELRAGHVNVEEPSWLSTAQEEV